MRCGILVTLGLSELVLLNSEFEKIIFNSLFHENVVVLNLAMISLDARRMIRNFRATLKMFLTVKLNVNDILLVHVADVTFFVSLSIAEMASSNSVRE